MQFNFIKVPDRVSVAILESVGIQMENTDHRLARLVSLASQKFLTDILTDSMLHWRTSNGQQTGLLSQSLATSLPSVSSANTTAVSVASSQNSTTNICTNTNNITLASNVQSLAS